MRVRQMVGMARWALLLLCTARVVAVEPITAVDADGVERTLNRIGVVTVVVYSNPALQDWTRATGELLYPFQGREGFRLVVVADLRGTLASWAKGMTHRRMMENLDREAQLVAPFYVQNGNSGDPRGDLSAVADFHGDLSQELGWERRGNHKRVILFGREGRELARWEELENPRELTDALARALP